MRTTIPYLLILVLLVAACSSGGEAAPVDTSSTGNDPAAVDTPVPQAPPPTSDTSATDNASTSASAPSNDTDAAAAQPQAETVTYNAPTWTQLPLVNARTGETFTLAHFAGRTVFVEPMATWCPLCRSQQQVVASALPNLDSSQYVFISLSVGEFIEDQDLAIYANNNGFNWIFAIATEELVQALVDTFGFSVQNPPSTPHFTISPTGVVSSLSTGHHSQEAIITEVTTANNS